MSEFTKGEFLVLNKLVLDFLIMQYEKIIFKELTVMCLITKKKFDYPRLDF